MICFSLFPGLISVYLLKNVATVIVALVMFGSSVGEIVKEGLESEIGTSTALVNAVPSVVLALIFNFVVPLLTTLVAIQYWGSLTDRNKFGISKLLYNHDQVIYE
jgi:ABC-type proline/glycine betaine transport system permease subunit